MAIRNIRVIGDEILTKKAKEVKEMTDKTRELVQDMLDTMYEKYGVGLAAPQVGVLKQIVVINVGEGPIVLINPEIIEQDGEQTGYEGCLSVPGKTGVVTDFKQLSLIGVGLLYKSLASGGDDSELLFLRG